MKKIMYGLRKKGSEQLMCVYATGNDGYDCTSVSFNLDEQGEIPWLVENKAVAERAANKSNKWWEAYYQSPENKYIGQLEVVTVYIDIKVE